MEGYYFLRRDKQVEKRVKAREQPISERPMRTQRSKIGIAKRRMVRESRRISALRQGMRFQSPYRLYITYPVKSY